MLSDVENLGVVLSQGT